MCLERALKSAGVTPEQVSYINAHGTSTPAGDMAEYRAIRKVFKHDVSIAQHMHITAQLMHIASLYRHSLLLVLCSDEPLVKLNRQDLRINSTKSIIGHLLGGASAVEAVATIKAIQTGWLHPTLNLDKPEEGVDPVMVVSGTKQQQKVRVALSNSFGFGGHNSCVLFKAFEE